MFRKVLVAYDGSTGAKTALERACDLAQAVRAELWAVAVLEHLPKYAASLGEVEELNAQGEEYLRSVLAGAHEIAIRKATALQTDQIAGQPAAALARYASEHGFDLIVAGHSGHSGVWGTFLGTTPDKLVRHAPCSVLVVR
jgi:nucleotide-binding universal stress UspA family protein